MRCRKKDKSTRENHSVQDITVIFIEELYFICMYMTNDDKASFDVEIVLEYYERKTDCQQSTRQFVRYPRDFSPRVAYTGGSVAE